MQSTAAAFPVRCARNDSRSSATVSTGSPSASRSSSVSSSVERVDGDHARAGARQWDGVHAEARAEIDHQRACGQLLSASPISALPASSAASTLPDIQE